MMSVWCIDHEFGDGSSCKALYQSKAIALMALANKLGGETTRFSSFRYPAEAYDLTNGRENLTCYEWVVFEVPYAI